jgi:predicted aspartyl protease
MPSIKVGFDRPHTVADCPETLALNGPTMVVQVGFDPAFDAKIPGAQPKLPVDQYQALIDTGASHSSIDANLAKKLNLPVVDRKPVSGVHGSQMVDICAAQIWLPVVNFTIHGQFALVFLRDSGQAHDVLLGRAMLRSFMFYFDGTTGYAKLSR